MKKEIKNEVKMIKEIALDNIVELIQKGNHLKVRWVMLNQCGEECVNQVSMGASPSCSRWAKNHRRNVRRQMRENNICLENICYG